MVYKRKYLFGIFGLLIVLHSFLLNSHAVDLLLDPANDDDDTAVVQQTQDVPLAVYHFHNFYSKHFPAPLPATKHPHSKHKSSKHGGFKFMLERTDFSYTSVKLNRDIHTPGQVSYHYIYFREINPPPPKFS